MASPKFVTVTSTSSDELHHRPGPDPRMSAFVTVTSTSPDELPFAAESTGAPASHLMQLLIRHQ